MKKTGLNNLSSEERQKLQSILESTNNHEIAKKILGTKAQAKPKNKNTESVFYTIIFVLILFIGAILTY